MKRNIFSIIGVYALFALSNFNASESYAADNLSFENHFKYGVLGSYAFEQFSVDFRSLPNVPTCCPQYTDGSGFSYEMGALFEMPIIDNGTAQENLWGGVKFKFKGLHSELRRDESMSILLDGAPAIGIVRHYVDADFKMLELNEYISYNPIKSLFANFGFSTSFLLSGTYKQIEKIISPADRVTFRNGKLFNNDNAGDIDNLNAYQFGLCFGVSYELPMNKENSLRLVPYLDGQMNFLDFVKDRKWSNSGLTLGIAIKYTEPQPPPPPPMPPLPPPMPEITFEQEMPILSVDLKVFAFDSTGKQQAAPALKVEDFTSHTMHPLLNYIFFDEGKSALPARYNKIYKEETVAFSIDKLNNKSALDAYYEILNIVGLRMRNNTDTKIKLVGCNSDTGEEKNNKKLSESRADSVKFYLTDVWGIEPNRIKIVAKNLPGDPTKSDDFGSTQENRRVEIIADDQSILEPISASATLRYVPPTIIKFAPSAKAEAGISKANLNVFANDILLRSYNFVGEIPAEVQLSLQTSIADSIYGAGELSYVLNVEDKLTQTAQVKGSFKIEKLTVEKKRTERIADKEFETYSLILFDYASSDLGKEHKKVIDFIKNRIKENSSVFVTGYTDAMGREEVNKKISEKRANEVARLLGKESVKAIGAGETVQLYDNALPEARFYCRTVIISIETGL